MSLGLLTQCLGVADAAAWASPCHGGSGLPEPVLWLRGQALHPPLWWMRPWKSRSVTSAVLCGSKQSQAPLIQGALPLSGEE